VLGIAFAAGLVGYVAVVRPWLGRLTYDRLVTGDGAKGRLSWSASLWLLVGPCAIAVNATDLGPGQAGFSLGADPAFTVAVAGAMVLVTAAIAVAERLGVRIPAWAPEAAAPPRTARERRGALATAVVAGLLEEVIFRGVFVGLFAYGLGLPLPVAAGLSLAVYVLCQFLRGGKAMLMLTLGGAVLTAAYLLTGSLLLPVVMHLLLDARALLAPQARGGQEAPAPVRG
jgi:hypothetical protein